MWCLSRNSLLDVTWLNILLCMASLANSPKPVQASSSHLPDDLEHRISAAAASATRSAEDFSRMRAQLVGLSGFGEALTEHLSVDQYSILNGSALASQSLSHRFRTLQLEGLDLSRRVADGDVKVFSDAQNFTEALEELAKDLVSHLALIREVLATVDLGLPRDARAKLEIALGAGDYSAVPAVAGGDTPDVSTQLARLNVIAKQLADRGDTSMLSETRRLGARFAREAALDDFRQLVRDVLARAEKLLKFVSSGKHRSGKNLQRRTDASTSFKWRPGTVCTLDDVNSASANFDSAVREFQGPLMKALLPPEVENLHRVIHTMQVMKHALLSELRYDAESDVESDEDMSRRSLATNCQKYFSGVGQLENDISHYKGLLQQQKQKKRRKKQKGTSEVIVPKKRPALSPLRF